MAQLTSEAHKYCKAALLEEGREYIIRLLEGVGVACYDDEETEELAEAAVESVATGDIEFDWSLACAKSCSHRTRMLWYDIDEIAVAHSRLTASLARRRGLPRRRRV